ncbi:MAG: FRG domain-containing protein [Idiomarina sp.]|nr:FRG domain-containing protein [Idiomarina sp.]
MSSPKIIRLKEWNQIAEHNPQDRQFIYRGQSNANWQVECALKRTLEFNRRRYEVNAFDLRMAERKSLKTFKTRAHLYLDRLPDEDDYVAWLSVMQHHGTPTRLIDFSRSFYVAMFFALIGASDDCCIWAIYENSLMKAGAKYAKENHSIENTLNGLRYGMLGASYEAANAILKNNRFGNSEDEVNRPGLLMIDVEKQIPRIAIQQGLFLFPCSLGTKFHENLDSLNLQQEGVIPPLIKFVIPYENRDDFLDHLAVMNITAETIYPGIDGFAQSIIQHDIL